MTLNSAQQDGAPADITFPNFNLGTWLNTTMCDLGTYVLGYRKLVLI